jgi:hypothetical protein
MMVTDKVEEANPIIVPMSIALHGNVMMTLSMGAPESRYLDPSLTSQGKVLDGQSLNSILNFLFIIITSFSHTLPLVLTIIFLISSILNCDRHVNRKVTAKSYT